MAEFIEVDKSSNNENSQWHYFLREKNGMCAKCKTCDRVIQSKGGTTTGLHKHLKSMHGIDLLKRPSDQEGVSVKKSKNGQDFKNIEPHSLAATLGRMTAKDGLPFSIFCTSPDLRNVMSAAGFKNLPKNHKTIKALVMDHGSKIKRIQKEEITSLKTNGAKFCVTFDEWTSKRNRRYMNIILHGPDSAYWDLGLSRMYGYMPAERCLETVAKKLESYGISLEKDIISIVTDGTSVMTKIGKLSPTNQQLCFAHGIQLAVLDVMYCKKKNNLAASSSTNPDELNECSDVSDDEDDDESSSLLVEYDDEYEDFSCEILSPIIRNVIDKVRKIVKHFRKSPKANENLQEHVKTDSGKELHLLLDSKTRWNSLAIMLRRFLSLKNSILKSLIDIKSPLTINENEFKIVSEVVDALEPVQATVEAICRRDSNLLKADAALRFMVQKLRELKSTLSLELLEALKRRITERRTDYSAVLQYLHSGRTRNNSTDDDFELFKLPKQNKIVTILHDLLKRLTGGQEEEPEFQDDEDVNVGPTTELSSCSKRKRKQTPLYLELNKAIATALAEKHTSRPEPKNLLSTIKKEIGLFEAGGSLGFHLQLAYQHLSLIPPTSVESERAFSSSGYICNKVRCRLNDDTLDMLYFLRSYFKKAGNLNENS